MAAHRRVKLLIDTSSSWGRDIIHGVSTYARQHGDWSLELEYHGRFQTLHLPRDWPGDGIIARVTNPTLAKEIIARGLPAVNVSWYAYGSPQIPRCTNNETTFGRLMAEYLLRRGFRSFGYMGSNRRQRPGYADRVERSFSAVLAEAGFACAIWRDRGKAGRAQDAGLVRWLSDLEHPLGVAVWGDHVGRRVAETCRIAKFNVPDDVAIISAEYDALMNSLSQPPLTTVDYLADRVGFEAARLLDRMMQSEPAPAEGVVVEPFGVITRQSTETIAVADETVAAALRLIRQRLGQALKVTQLLGELKVGRRAPGNALP